ncbi:MAG: hypothetical protein HY773_01545 [Candidatus Terrybacteria bacterium]|nr:hypothetical protein [Candidatus Terrybacteria bacterium]
MGYFDTKNTLLLLIGFINLIFGLVIYIKNRKSQTNFWFFLVVLSVTFWIFSMFFYRSIEESVVFCSRILYLSASFIPIIFLYFSFIFPEEKFHLKMWQKYLLLIPFITIAIISLLPDALIKGVNIIPDKENEIIFNNQLHLLYAFYISGYFVLAYINLFRKYLKTVENIIKTQIKYVLLGTLIATIIGVSSNLILPLLSIFTLNWLGQISIIFMIVFIAYAITKHHLMNIRIIATELFAGSILLILLVNFLTSRTAIEWLIRGFLFVTGTFFGYLLIRSVLKEVRQREEIEKLAGELERANVRLKELDKEKSDFVTITSHQLRSPLTAIKGYTSMMLEGSYGPISDKVKEILDRIFQSSNRLVYFISDLLNLSRIERGKMEYDFKKINFRELAQEVFEDFKTINIKENKGMEMSFEAEKVADYSVIADFEKIRQVVYNLMDNAMKYNKVGGFVKINLQLITNNQQQKSVLLKVQDNGIGMSKESLTRIFEKFIRGRNGSSVHTEGTGLGLYVAREIAKAHGGDIRAESEGEGKGSTFYLELPMDFIPPQNI